MRGRWRRFNERFVVRMVTAEFLRSLAADVAAGRPVELSFDDFPCFTAEALEGRAHVTPAALAEISAGSTRSRVFPRFIFVKVSFLTFQGRGGTIRCVFCFLDFL